MREILIDRELLSGYRPVLFLSAPGCPMLPCISDLQKWETVLPENSLAVTMKLQPKGKREGKSCLRQSPILTGLD